MYNEFVFSGQSPGTFSRGQRQRKRETCHSPKSLTGLNILRSSSFTPVNAFMVWYIDLGADYIAEIIKFVFP